MEGLSQLPDVIRELVEAYVLEAKQLVDGRFIRSVYWEARHDATTEQWNQMIRQIPYLASYCPHCPLVPLLSYNHVECALRMLQDNVNRWDRTTLQDLLRYCALCGDMPIIEELRLHHGLTKLDAQADDNQILMWATCSGHVNVLQELRMNWGLDVQDVRARNNWALHNAVSQQRIDILQELRAWGLDEQDVDANIVKQAIDDAVFWNSVLVLRELRTNWSLRKRHVQAARSNRSLPLPQAVAAELELF